MVKLYQYDEFEECEHCGVDPAEVLFGGSHVCRRCEKDLKRALRKAENVQRRREERADDVNYRRNR